MMGGGQVSGLILAALAAAVVARVAAAQTVLDDFDMLEGWSATASEGAQVWIAPDAGHTGNGMRIGFDLNTAGGYILVHKDFSLPLPKNYAFTFFLRGEAQQNNFEFKLIEPGGKSVWWRKQHDYVFPTEWQRITIPKSRLELAWGAAGSELKRVGAIEFAISPGAGGKGSIWIDDLALEEREPAAADGRTPTVTASSAEPGHEAALMLDTDVSTRWKSATVPETQEVVIDLLTNREYGGLVIDWDPDDYATAYEVQTSNDGEHWTTAYAARTGKGGRDYVYTPDTESRYIRLVLQQSSRGHGYGIANIAVKPVEFSASSNQFFAAVAQDAPVGMYPKYLYGRQTYWTVFGVNGDGKEALLNEEGMLEVDKGAFSIEPFLYLDGTLISWNEVRTDQELEDGYLPMPSVTWQHEHVGLKVTAFAAGSPGSSTIYARYRVENRSETPEHVHLFLAIRPFQVNPPWQSLNMSGGVSAIREIRFDGRVVWVNREKAVISLTPPDRFGSATFEQGGITDFLRQNKLPPQSQTADAVGFASGALQYGLSLNPGEHEDVYLAVPFHEPYVAAAIGLGGQDAPAFVSRQFEATRKYWQTILDRVDVQLPPAAERLVRTLKATLAYILINRDGPAIRPGSRNYARSWIRDGALTSAALLEMGCTPEVRAFIEWFARYQLPDGKVPCCVDRRGADPAPEDDSNGEFIYAVAEYYRFTRDVGFVHDMWPHVVLATDYMAGLRRKRMTPAFRTPEKQAFYGLLPESISHEGYSSQPVHSYWDDFFALRGFKDAASLAVVVGDDEHAASYAALRDEFRRDLYASIAKVMADSGADYIPGSVDLVDLDPTSTAIAVSPGGELGNLPEPALTRTFERYYADVLRRLSGGEWDAYTPYELRNVDVLVRMHQPERALEVLDFLLAGQRPAPWSQWAEVVWRDPGAPNFIGDMPHTWVGSSFIRSVRSLFVYEREADGALVIGAGVPNSWWDSESGVVLKRVPTYYGVLNAEMRGVTPHSLRVRLSGDLTLPPGNIVIEAAPRQTLIGVTVNGKPVQTFTASSATVGEFPADVVLEYQPPPADAATPAPAEAAPTPAETPGATPAAGGA